jgi:hypothetical protein
MKTRLAASCIFLSSVLSPMARAEDQAEQRAQAFTAVYSALCVKHMRNLVGLQEKLKGLSAPSTAYALLNPNAKDAKAWVIPSRYGSFVLTLSKQGSTCSVHSADMDVKQAKKYFNALVKDAPKPIQVTSPAQTPGNLPHMGPVQIVSSLWLKRRDPRVLALSLTTTNALDAPVHAMLTVSWVQTGL